MNESHLARLTYTFAIFEPEATKMSGAIIDIIIKLGVKEEAYTSCSRSSFTWVAVNDHNILLVGFQICVHLVHEAHQKVKWWRVMVLPITIRYSPLKLFLIVRTLRYIKYKVFSRMFFIQEFLDISVTVSPYLSNIVRWKTHDYYSILAYVREVQVIVVLLDSLPGAADFLAKIILHFIIIISK